VLGPEHEFSLVDKELRVLPISDQIIKAYCGKFVNFIERPNYSFGKEMQLHVMEIKANLPFKSPVQFEETMHKAVLDLNEIVSKHGKAKLLGTGMHPLLKLNQTGVWPHRHKKIYDEYSRVFDLQQHGWLNIQSFHLNLPFQKEADAIIMHNLLVNLIPYLPAIAASSPIYECKKGPNNDNRLHFYKLNQKEVPTVTGKVIPEYAESFKQYKKAVIERYSDDLALAGANDPILDQEWVNSRGLIFRFDRCALEIRLMDEQECIKMDVALSCYVRAALRGMLKQKLDLQPFGLLLKDYNAIVKDGFNAQTSNPLGKTARQICQYYYNLANEHATLDEKKYLDLIKRRIDEGSLSEIIRTRVQIRSQKTDYQEAIVGVYSKLINCLINNAPYF
jgi:gamma-glutamyl:cysteine ligase YbdK (ATP-grasp superfamily)